MQDLFLLIDYLNQELEVAKINLRNLQIYFADILDDEYKNMFLLKEKETCLDFMRYEDFNKAVGNELKSSLKKLEELQKEYKENIDDLKYELKKTKRMIVELSTFSPKELGVLCKLFSLFIPVKGQSFSVYIINESEELILNPLCVSPREDFLYFIKFYISIKLSEPDLNVEEIYSLYQMIEDEEDLNLV